MSSDPDALLARLLPELKPRRFATRWSEVTTPHSALVAECQRAVTDAGSPVALRQYLQDTPIVQQSFRMLIEYQALVSNVRPEQVPEPMRDAAARGWHVVRWLPTFLLIDAPAGRVLTNAASPLNQLLVTARGALPVLSAARDAFNDIDFAKLRNAVAHWSFSWNVASVEETLELCDDRTGERHLMRRLEAEAFHLVAYSVMYTLSRHVFDAVNPPRAGA